MKLAGGVVGGAIGGAIGAAIWAAVAYFLNVEIGWIAWGVGGLVGLGTALGTGGGHPAAGVLAVAITVVSILGGKYASIQLALGGEKEEIVESALGQLGDEEYVVSWIANEIASERENAGEEVAWPDPPEEGDGSIESEYPPDIWAEAEGRWQSLTPAEQGARRAEIETEIRENFEVFFGEFDMIEAIKGSMGALDILFFALAIGTAWQLGSGRSRSSAREEGDSGDGAGSDEGASRDEESADGAGQEPDSDPDRAPPPPS